MATDFFARQDVARRNTLRLVVLFALALVAITVSIELLLAATMGYSGRDPRTGTVDWTLVADPRLVSLALLGTLTIVGGGSLFKIAQLRGGGRVVAEELGGRLLTPDTVSSAEQRLLNVVQEMAIASGTPTPPVYLLEHEPGINAFAAGFTPNDAIIGITRGAVERLTRDELQGVVAHEFSHILNGDMRLNIRLIGVLHGILIIGMLGYFLLRATAFSGYRRSRSRQDGGAIALLALGAGLMVVGFFGTFFGNMIKAAVSRQREFLADASAVQFTRQPSGIAGALKKIGAIATGSRIQSPNAPEASHMFFGRATQGLTGMFSTHPPLAERIQRIQPEWDGRWPEVEIPAVPIKAPVGAVPLAASGAVGVGLKVASALDQVGQPSEAHIRYAERLVQSLPAPLIEAAREPYSARAIVYALLLDRDAEARRVQLTHLAAEADSGVYEETRRLAPLVAQLDVRARLPVLDITLPALRTLTKGQYVLFKQNVTALVESDNAIDLFEWSLHRILLRDLEAHYAEVSPPRIRHRTTASVRDHCQLVLSMLAYAGHQTIEEARRAFDLAWQCLELPREGLRPVDDLQLDAFDSALAALEQSVPQVKRRVLEAAATSITADRTVTRTEAELLRAISASLGCPMPPLLAA